MELLISRLTATAVPSPRRRWKPTFLAVMEATDLKLGKIAQPVRMALTGTTVSPGIFEIIVVLGKERTLARLEAARQYILNLPAS